MKCEVFCTLDSQWAEYILVTYVCKASAVVNVIYA